MPCKTIDAAPSPARSRTGSSDPAPVGSPADIAEEAAAAHYASGYWCGESVLKAVNDVLGTPMPADVYRLASGFCEGLGGSRCICGALAGGVMATGLVLGRVSPRDAWEPSYDAAAELRRRWTEDQGAETCSEVAERFGGMEKPERWAHCTLLVGRTARWVVELAGDAGVASPGERMV